MNYRIISSLLVVWAIMSGTSCMKNEYFPCIKPRGTITEEVRFAGNFNSVDLKLNANVHITQGEDNSIVIAAPENLLEYITTSGRNNRLEIDNSKCIRNRGDEIDIYLTMQQISAVKVTGSGKLSMDNDFVGDHINMEVSGSGNIFFAGDYNSIQSIVTGSGNILLTGKSMKHDVQISGSGMVNALQMWSENAFVRISGSGNSKINAAEKIDGRISGSGNVYYAGNPAVSISISGSGKLIHIPFDYEY